MKIFIDAGHGAHDPGAKANNLVEKNINLIVAKEVKKILESYGIKVLMSREKDIYVTLINRAKMANKFGADYFISIHHNAGGGDGYEVIHSVVGGKGKELAEKIGKEFEGIGQNKRRIYSRTNSRGADYYAVIRLTRMPSIITEFGFMDSEDKNIFDEYSELKKEAKAIVNGILKQFGLDIIKDEFVLALDKLLQSGVINSPDYWLNNAVSGKQVNGEYVGTLIKRVAKLLNNNVNNKKTNIKTEKNLNSEYYEDGKIYFIKTRPQNIEIKILGDTLLNKNVNGINGTFFDVNDPSSTEKVWGIAANDCKWVGNSAYATHAWRGYPQSVISYYKDGSLGVEVVKSLYEMSKAVIWSIGGVGKNPDEEGFNDKYSDVLRTANHTVLGYDKEGYVYLVAIKDCSIQEIKVYMKKLKIEEYILLDGGGSTQLNYKGDGVNSSRKINTAVLLKEI